MAALCSDQQQSLYGYLIKHSHHLPNGEAYARILSSWYQGKGELPAYLGLSLADYRQWFAYYFHGASLPLPTLSLAFNSDRFSEQVDLRALLLPYSVQPLLLGKWATEILIAGCMGNNHLWQDLGFWSRTDLSQFMQTNFPRLAAKNSKDMKWKKFLYKQLCLSEGIYTCRAPSCEVCTDYSVCFGPEE